jgi:phage-related protein
VSRPLGDGLHEVRTRLPENRISRIIFYIDESQRMVLLHGFIKKTRKLPNEDLALAQRNREKHERNLR